MANRHFTLVVVGDNPDELIKKYDGKIKVEPYLVYSYKDAKKYYEKHLKMYEEALKILDKDDPTYDSFSDRYNELKAEDITDFYLELTEDFEIDDETGDAYSDVNPDAKYDVIRPAHDMAMPMFNKNGEEIFNSKKGEIDWTLTHGNNKEVYEFAWDSVMGKRKPHTPEEEVIYNNMKNRTQYFLTYSSRENYVSSNTSFWGYAFLSKKTGWVELEDTVNQFEWVNNFYKKFIAGLKDDEQISLYECIRNN